MSLKVMTNESAMRTNVALWINQRAVSNTLQKLATGHRINTAADDAAGLSIASKMTASLRGLGVAARNANDALSLLDTADGALVEVSAMLQRMRELAVQSANGTLSASDRSGLQAEFSALQEEIGRIRNQTEWNGIKLLDGTLNISIQVGSNAGQTKRINIQSVTAPEIDGPLVISGSGALAVTPLYTQNYTTLIGIDTTSFTAGGTIAIRVQLGSGTSAASYDLYRNAVTYGGAQNRPINSLANAYDVPPGTTTNLSYNFTASATDRYLFGIEGNWFSPPGATNTFSYTITVSGAGAATQPARIDTQGNASGSITAIDRAIQTVDATRASIGSDINGLRSRVSNIETATIHLSESRSRVLDANYAELAAELSKRFIISNAGASMLAQANQLPRIVLSILDTR